MNPKITGQQPAKNVTFNDSPEIIGKKEGNLDGMKVNVGKASGGKGQSFLAGLKSFFQSIGNFFKSLTQRTAQENIAPQNTRGAQKTATKDEAPTIKGFKSGLLPEGIVIGDDDTITGSVELTKTSTNGRDWGDPMGKALGDTVDRMFRSTKDVEVNGKTLKLSEKSLADMPRMNIQIGDGFNTKGQKPEDLAQALRGFTGSDNATTVLSGALTQYMLRPMEILPTPGDGIATFRLPDNQYSKTDLNIIKTFHFEGHNGESETIEGKPSQYGGAKFNVSINQDGDFSVNIEWPMMVSGFRNQETTNQAPLGGNDHLMKVTISTEFVIKKEEADRGELSFGVTKQPLATFSGKLSEVNMREVEKEMVAFNDDHIQREVEVAMQGIDDPIDEEIVLKGPSKGSDPIIEDLPSDSQSSIEENLNVGSRNRAESFVDPKELDELIEDLQSDSLPRTQQKEELPEIVQQALDGSFSGTDKDLDKLLDTLLTVEPKVSTEIRN